MRTMNWRAVDAIQSLVSVCAACSLLCLALAHGTASAASGDEPDWDSLNQGDVITRHIKDAEGVAGVRAELLVRAKRERIWETFLDYEHFPRIFENIKKIRVLESSGKGARIEIQAKAVFTDLRYVLQREYRIPQHELSWNRVSGDLKIIRGSWRILDTPSADTKRLIYESFVDTGSPVLTWLVRLGYRREVEKTAIRLRDWIEKKGP